MKISISKLKEIYSKIASFDVNSAITSAKSIKAADLKFFAQNISDKYFNPDFLLFSKYTPFIAISVYLSILVPLSYFAYESLYEKQKLNSQYRLQRDQIDTLNNNSNSLESRKAALEDKKKSINALLLELIK